MTEKLRNIEAAWSDMFLKKKKTCIRPHYLEVIINFFYVILKCSLISEYNQLFDTPTTPF